MCCRTDGASSSYRTGSRSERLRPAQRQERRHRRVARSLDFGVGHIDTSDAYGPATIIYGVLVDFGPAYEQRADGARPGPNELARVVASGSHRCDTPSPNRTVDDD